MTEGIHNSSTLVGRTTAEVAVLSTSLVTLILLSLLGNTAVIIAILNSNHLRDEISNRLTINLAITDLLNGTFVMTSSLVSTIHDDWHMGAFYCDFICAANYCLIIASMLTLCFISIDRYYAIIYPLHYVNIITPTKINIMIAYTWFQGLAFCATPVIFQWVEFDYWEVIPYRSRQTLIIHVSFVGCPRLSTAMSCRGHLYLYRCPC